MHRWSLISVLVSTVDCAIATIPLATDINGCATSTAALQAILDKTSAAGGGWAGLPCGFHATGPLTLPDGVKIGANHCVGGTSRSLTLGACSPGTQQHIIAVGNGTGQVRHPSLDPAHIGAISPLSRLSP